MNKKILYLLPFMLLTSCGSFNDQKITSERYEINHQIGARPVLKEITLKTGPDGNILGNNGVVQAFIMDYERRGHGAFIIEGNRIGVARAVNIVNSYGISSSRIEKSYNTYNDIKLSFSAFSVVLPECGRFQDDDHLFSFSTPSNKPSMDYGCSTQRDLGLMMQDPMDAIRMRGPLSPTDSSITGETRVNAMHQYQAPEKAQAQSEGSSQ